jgi:hypothetical protein
MALEEAQAARCPQCAEVFDAALVNCPKCVVPLCGKKVCLSCGRAHFAYETVCQTQDCPGPLTEYVPVSGPKKRKERGESSADPEVIVEPAGEVHNVKGTKRDGKYCVKVSAERVTWIQPGTLAKARRKEEGESSSSAEVDKPAKTFLRPCLVVARLKCTDVGKRKSPPIPLSAIDDKEADAAEDELNDDAEIVAAESSNAPVEGDEEAATAEEIKDELGKLGELREFDKGHLVALFLGGADSSWNIIPQVRDCNRNAWLAMEQWLYAFTKDKENFARRVFVAVEDNTLGQKPVRITIFPYYADRGGQNEVGDPRIPVWLYVQVRLGKKAVAHFSFANECRKKTAFPDDEMVACFKRAYDALGIPRPRPANPTDDVKVQMKELYEDPPPYVAVTTRTDDDVALAAMNLDDDRRARILRVLGEDYSRALMPADIVNLLDSLDPLLKDDIKFYKGLRQSVDTTAGPYRALQWLYNNPGHCDGTKCVPAQSFAPVPFESPQIAVFRKFNLWVNGGQMISDGAKEFSDKPWNEDERPDPYRVMDEASGQAYPEVDHIVPKKSGGLNSYSNARLVSFSLNHIYREKPARCPGINELIMEDMKRIGGSGVQDHIFKLWESHGEIYKDENIVETGFRIAGADPRFRDDIGYRRDYLRQMEKRHKLCDRLVKLSERFEAVRSVHAEGCKAFRDDPDPELKDKMRIFQMDLPLALHGPKQFGLDGLSDEIDALNS